MEISIITDVLTEVELNSLCYECDQFSKNYSVERYHETSCAIDLFENISLSDNDFARSDEFSYFQKRWMNTTMEDETKETIRTLLTKKLPQLLQLVAQSPQLYLFNEHYVVKPANSEIIFRWHRDIDEQLQSCLSSNVKYFSLWCPLDSTTSENGTLMVPTGTLIQQYAYQDLISGHLVVQHEHVDPVNLQEANDTVPDDNEEVSPHEEGLSINATRGSVVIFSSHLPHCSGPNTTSNSRRVFYSQYSESVITADGSNHSLSPLCFAIPCQLKEISPCVKKRRRSAHDDNKNDSDEDDSTAL